jgi:hypothetical protein
MNTPNSKSTRCLKSIFPRCYHLKQKFSIASGVAAAALLLPAHACVTATVGAVWQNTAMTAQTGAFTATCDATPSASPTNAVVALSDGAQTAYANFSCLARFNTSGDIDARNGGAFAAAATIPYKAGVAYHFRLVVNVAAQTYSIYVTPAGGSELTVGLNYAFRIAATTLNWWGVSVETAATGGAGTVTVCNFSTGGTTSPGEGPFGGTPAAIPGTIQAENYDTGGQGVAYNVTSINGTDNGYRTDGVDLETTLDTGGGVDLGWTAASQWFKYTVNVATAGTYTVSFRVADPAAVTDAFHLANSSGTNLSGSVNLPFTGGWQTWATVTASVNLPAGQQVLTLDQDTAGWNINDMGFATFGGTVAAPSFSPGGGTYSSAQNVMITTATGGASIRYTTDGSTPSETAGTIYSGPVNISSNATLNAIAYESGFTDSSITSATYTVGSQQPVAAPTFSPGGGSYTSAQNVTIATITGGASIRYTTDGSTPSETSGTIYSGPVNISSTTTLQAIAYASGFADSSITSATYTISTGGGTLPSDVLAELNGFNVVWTSPSTTGSAGSMPIGNGDITANVWVESGGDLVMYIGKSDTWSEGTRLLKVGRLRIHLSPNPFTAGAPFNQTLNYYNGEIDITAGPGGSQVSLRIYIDANQPVIRIAASGQQNFTMSCTNEIWRSSTLQINSGIQDSFRGVASAPTKPSESADQTLSLPDRLVWYHRNASSFFSTIFNAENLNGFSGSYTDPWASRIFGATVLASNFSVVNSQQLQSTSGNNFLVSVYPYTTQASSVSTWQAQMNNQIAQVAATPEATARNNHYAWWDGFWNRSWIFVSGDANAASVTSGYLAQRFTEACQGRGPYPIKFNGGSFTFDHNGQNGDYRAWGPGYWNQNTRLLYWPMLASGDFDMMKPFFNIYMNMLPLQAAATSKYYGHGGAFFPETFNIFGLYYADDWGWNNSGGTTCGDTYIKYHYSGGLETLAMMLAYYNYTQDSSFATNYVVPMATQAIRFFNLHWSKTNGKLVFYPANACEMYWSCTNPTDYIAGLQYDIQQLLALPGNLTTPALVSEWNSCLAALPPLPMDPTGTFVRPAQTFGAGMNTENPECYCIFPYRIFGLGLPNFNTGLATFNNRTVKNFKFDWSQDPIEEALVGLTGAAQTDVINNFKDTDSTARFQAFWSTRNDYVPTEDTGGAAMSALQYMLMQCVGSQIMVLPAWPAGWNVDFKLNAPGNTSVRLILQGGVITQLAVTPASRAGDVIGGPPIRASNFNIESGVQTENCAEGGLDVGFINVGSYTAYNQIDLTGFTSFNARVASAGAGGNIEIHLDSPTGTLIGTCAVPITGGWQTWVTQTCSITPATGSHTVYLVYTGGDGNGNLFNIEWFTFNH